MSQATPALDSTTTLEALFHTNKIYRNLRSGPLVEHAVRRGEAQLADNGALVAYTGKYTGRTPKDKFTVKDSITADRIHWGEINQPLDPIRFENLFQRMLDYLSGRELFVQ